MNKPSAGVTSLRAEEIIAMTSGLGDAWNYDTMYPTLKSNPEPTGYECKACPRDSHYDNGSCVCEDANSTWNASTNACECNTGFYKKVEYV